MPGFEENIENCKTVEELPTNCKKYILKIEELISCKIKIPTVKVKLKFQLFGYAHLTYCIWRFKIGILNGTVKFSVMLFNIQ